MPQDGPASSPRTGRKSFPYSRNHESLTGRGLNRRRALSRKIGFIPQPASGPNGLLTAANGNGPGQLFSCSNRNARARSFVISQPRQGSPWAQVADPRRGRSSRHGRPLPLPNGKVMWWGRPGKRGGLPPCPRPTGPILIAEIPVGDGPHSGPVRFFFFFPPQPARYSLLFYYPGGHTGNFR